MCERCGMSQEQYEAACLVLHLRCAVSWYQRQGIDPSFWRDQGIEEFTDRRVAAAGELADRYHEAHPGKPMTKDQFHAWFEGWMARVQLERDLASTRGC